jgi:general secretion pathway protein D
MRRNSRLKRGVASVVLVAFLSGCATATPPRVEAPAPLPPPPVLVPPVATAPTPAPLPTMSVGPRAEAPTPEARPATVTPTPPPALPVAPPTAPPVPPGQRGRFIVLNFDNADIETVIHAASEIVGFNYVLGPGVSGKKVTVQTSGRIPQEDVFGVLLAILEVHGVTAVRSGSLYKIVPVEGARERAVPTIVGGVADATRTADEIVTQIIPIRFAGVNELGTLLRPLISSRGTLIANRETGILIVTDSASNISRLLDIIKLVDVEVALDELQIVPLQYAEAGEMANILNQLFQAGRLRAGTGTSGSGVAPAPAGALPPPVAPAAGAPGGSGSVGGSDRPPLIVPERRSNALIIHARKGEMETIRKVIDKIDVNISGGRRVFIYYAENAKAKDLGATLNAIYTGRETTQTTSSPTSTGGSQVGRLAGQPAPPLPPPPSVAPGGPLGLADAPLAEGQVRFIADETTNAIIVTTTPRQWMDIEATIKELDRMPRQVLIEVLVAEIALTDDLRLGIDWALKTEEGFRAVQSSLNPPSATSGLSDPAPSFPIAKPISRLAPLAGGGLTALVFSAGTFIALINALAAQNRVNIVSNPHVLTSENKKAIINVSQSVPIVTGQQTGTTVTGTSTTTGVVNPTTTTTPIGSLNQTVEYRDAGVILTVTPRIGERGTVALDVKQEVNAVGPPVPPTLSPSFNKREAETSVVLLNNQTLVLGGLIQDKVTLNDRGIPFLKNIPLIGYMFGFKERAIERTELLMMITPKVIGTAVDAARVTDEMRHATQELNNAVNSSPLRPRSGLPSTILPMAPPVPAPPPGPPSSAVPGTEPVTITAPVAPPQPPPPAMPPPALPPRVPQVAPAPPPPAVPPPASSSVTPADPATAPAVPPAATTPEQPARPIPRTGRPRLVPHPPPAPAPDQPQPPSTPPPTN